MVTQDRFIQLQIVTVANEHVCKLAWLIGLVSVWVLNCPNVTLAHIAIIHSYVYA